MPYSGDMDDLETAWRAYNGPLSYQEWVEIFSAGYRAGRQNPGRPKGL